MVADLQSRIGKRVPALNLNPSCLKRVHELPERSFPPQSHQDLAEESRLTDGATLPKRSRRSAQPRTPGKKSIPLLNRIQMDQGDPRNTAQTEKSLIERIEIGPDDMNGHIYRPRQERLGSNEKFIDDNVFSSPEHGSNHKKRRRHSRETCTSKPRKDFRLHDDNVIFPNQASSHGEGSSNTHHTHRPLEVNPAFAPESVTSKAFLDHLLPLAQRIADVRMENSQVGTPHSSAAVDSSVITAEVLAQFSQQLINLRRELHHHQQDNGPRMLPIEETQAIAISADCDENRSPLGASLNGHGHVFEGTISHEPWELGTKEPPRTPTPDKRHPPSFHSSSELRGTRKDFRRSWDHYDYRHSRRDDPDRRYRRSISPRTPYSSPNNDRRNSSPPRYRNRRGSPLPHRRRPSRSPLSPERRPHSSKKSKDSTESASNPVKESCMRADGMGPMSLQDFLREYRGIASPQQETRKVSELNVPGIWLAFQGSQEIGMSTIEFELDEPTAIKWNLNSNATLEDTESLFDNQDRLQPSLELFCFSLNDVQITMQNLRRDVASHDLVKALSSLENAWPPQGHLIVSINAESQNQKFWFPDTFRRKDSIKLEEFLHKGVNFVKFINLSDLSGKVLVLLATENGIQNDYTRLKLLLPERGGGTSFQKAIQTVSKG